MNKCHIILAFALTTTLVLATSSDTPFPSSSWISRVTSRAHFLNARDDALDYYQKFGLDGVRAGLAKHSQGLISKVSSQPPYLVLLQGP